MSGVLQGVALAYDLCYEGWPEDYRQRVAKEIQSNAPKSKKGKVFNLEFLAGGGKYPPASNHYGAYLAGPGFAALALKGDPGVDSARMEKLLQKVNASLKTVLTKGFGNGGWFGEGTGSDKTAIFPGVSGLIQSLRIAAGKDWGEGASNGRNIILARALELISYPNSVRRPPRGKYAHGTWFWPGARRDSFGDRGGWSQDGLFAIGIGTLPERYRPGMVWIYNHFVEPNVEPTKKIYEARIDPLHAVYAFVNWPLDKKEANPSETFPLAVHDSLHGYILCRGGFKDENDVLFTGLARRGPVGYHKVRAQQDVWIWGMGYRVSMGAFSKAPTSHWKTAKDGSACFTVGENAWAVDYSGAAGCDAVIVSAAPQTIKVEPPVKTSTAEVPTSKINLTGSWDNTVSIKQSGQTLTATTPKGWKTAKGALNGRQIKMQFGQGGKTKLNGKISADGNTIDWDNGYSWERSGKKVNWTFKDGEKVKPAKIKVGSKEISIVTFSSSGKHPEPKVEGNQLKLGEQTISFEGNKISLSKFGGK